MSEAKPSRSLVILAGILTQVTGAGCLLLGTVAFALTLQNKEHALTPILIGWIVAALSNVVSGGLVYRGNLASLVIAALLDGVFGVVLLQLRSTLGGLLRMLPPSDVETVAMGLGIMSIVMLVAVLACVIAIPQARRYSAWLDGSEPQSAASTAPGFPPPPVSAHAVRTTMIRHAVKSRRRLVIAIIGLAVGVGGGVAVIATTATTHVREGDEVGSAAKADPKADPGTATDPKDPKTDPKTDPRTDPKTDSKADPKTDPKTDAKTDPKTDKPHTEASVIATPQDLLVAEHTAIGKGDIHALAALAAPQVFAFGVDAAEVAEGRDGVEAILKHDLGVAPADGFGVDGKYLQLGEWRDHAWIAEELEVTGKTARRYSITQLAAKVGGQWTVVAWHWAIGVSDGVAERLAATHTMPVPKLVPDGHEGPDDLDAAFRAAFASRKAFADGFSTREDAFNFGSAPGEHVPGGPVVKKLFSRLSSNLELVGGARVIGGNTWDKSQAAITWIGFGAANVAYRSPGHATQVFRVLAVLVRDPDWRIVQTQFSNGGPAN